MLLLPSDTAAVLLRQLSPDMAKARSASVLATADMVDSFVFPSSGAANASKADG